MLLSFFQCILTAMNNCHSSFELLFFNPDLIFKYQQIDEGVNFNQFSFCQVEIGSVYVTGNRQW